MDHMCHVLWSCNGLPLQGYTVHYSWWQNFCPLVRHIKVTIEDFLEFI